MTCTACGSFVVGALRCIVCGILLLGCASTPLPIADARKVLNRITDGFNAEAPVVMAACSLPAPPPPVTAQQCLTATAGVRAASDGLQAAQTVVDSIAQAAGQ